MTYQIQKKDGTLVTVNSPQDVPDSGQVDEFREPIVRISFLLPSKHIGDIMQLAVERRVQPDQNDEDAEPPRDDSPRVARARTDDRGCVLRAGL